MYSNVSNFVEGVDNAFVVILGISAFFLVGITAVMIWFVYRYNQKRNPKATQVDGHTGLEIAWTIIPVILVLVMFYFGWAGWRPTREKAPDDALEVKSIARMWSWTFEYENGKITDTLYVPENKAIKLNLEAMDVIHSLYIPAFRLKQDMVPGKPDVMWFVAQKPGEYDLFCAEYCGLRHSYMATSVVVMPDSLFEKWYVDTTQVADVTVGVRPGAAGLTLIRRFGCNACHSSDGSKLVGPSFKNIYGHDVTVITGGNERVVQIDDEYIRRSIYDPNADVVKGYSKGLMLSYKNQVTDEDIDLIIEYLKSLSDQ